MRVRTSTFISVFAMAAAFLAGGAVSAPAQAGGHPALHVSDCDPIDPTACLLPFPSDWYTVADRSTDTGRRVSFTPEMLPTSAQGAVAVPDAWNRSDGFSPGSQVMAHVPRIDLAKTGAAPITDIGASLDRNAPIVLIDATTGERWPYWAEMDSNSSDPDRQALIIRPAKNFQDGHRYVVGLRNLRDASGHKIAAGEAFAKISRKKLHKSDALYERQSQLEKTFRTLKHAKVSKHDLFLAWDFTVASTDNLTGNLLHIRDDALRQLHRHSPDFTVDSVTNFTPEQNAQIAREIRGTVTVPNYLDTPGGPTGSTFNYGRDGRPDQLGDDTISAPFRCQVSHTAATKPSQPALYGHGLLGSLNEVGSGPQRAMVAGHNFMYCATNWIGMAEDDIPTVVGAQQNISGFSAVADRAQQGVLNAIFLGRALLTKDGFASDQAFQNADGDSLISTRYGLAYDGNSQGAIMGGMLVAVSPDIKRGVLGVTGMNYSTLLNRSVDYTPFQQILDQTYPDKTDQQVVFGLFQMLWDRAETNGYANHLTGRPLPGTPRHEVLLHVAFGDHQVANVAAEVEARTIGARLLGPGLTVGRSPDVSPFWGIKRSQGPVVGGSALVMWDSGTPRPPLTNTPPFPPTYGEDPHSDPRNMANGQRQKAVFLKSGLVIDVCDRAPCLADPS